MYQNIKFNNNNEIYLPIITTGSPTITISDYTYTNEPFYYYERGQNQAQFGILIDYANQVRSLGNYYADASVPYYMCATLREPHNAEYYASGQGKELIDNLLAHGVWIMGDMEHGGLMMIGISASNKFAFVEFDGVYKHNEWEDYYRYGFGSTCSILDGQEIGTFSFNEIINSALGLFTDVTDDIAPLWMFYRPDGYEFAYVSGFIFNLGEYVSQWTMDATIQDGMSDASYFGDFANLHYLPARPWCPTWNDAFDPTAGRAMIGGDMWFTDYYKLAGNVYGDSFIDPSDNPYGDGGTLGDNGGGGKFNDHSDQGGWTDPSQFTTDALNSGFFTLYNPSKGEVQEFNDFLFTDITDSMSTQLKKLVSNPLDYVVFMSMCHFQPNLKSGTYPIKYCGIDSGVTSAVVDKQIQFINCGTIHIEEANETSSYLSYSPYFETHLYLPYIGMVDINTDDIMDSDVNIQYIVDLLTGSCVAQVKIKRDKRTYGDTSNHEGIVIGEYTGNCYLNLPMSSSDWRGLFQSVVQFAGGLTAVAGGSASGLGSIASAVTTEKTKCSRSGQLGSNYGYLGFQKPYFIFERPVIAIPENWSSYVGLPSNMIYSLKDCHGYTEVEDDGIWTNKLNGITAEEADLLRQVFSRGVYLNWNGEE